MKTIILKVLNHSSVFQILEAIFGCQELQSAVWDACFPGLPHGDLPLTYRCNMDTWEPRMPAISGRSI